MAVPTFDIADLEKKSPEELDAILRQLDEVGQKNKRILEDMSTQEEPVSAKPTPAARTQAQARGGKLGSASQPRGNGLQSGANKAAPLTASQRISQQRG